MNEVKEFLKVLSQDQKAQALLRQEREPASAEEAAARYAAIAEKLGFSLRKEDILSFLKNREQAAQALAGKAEQAVNKASPGRIHVWVGEEIGSMKRTAPSRIAPRNPNTISHLHFMASPSPAPSSSRRDGRRSRPP